MKKNTQCAMDKNIKQARNKEAHSFFNLKDLARPNKKSCKLPA